MSVNISMGLLWFYAVPLEDGSHYAVFLEYWRMVFHWWSSV